WRVFEAGVPPQERAIGPEPFEVEIDIEHVGVARSATRRSADAQLFAKEIRSTVADAFAHSLGGTHAAQDDLESVGAPAGFEAFLESSLDEAVDKVDHPVLAFGPEFGH